MHHKLPNSCSARWLGSLQSAPRPGRAGVVGLKSYGDHVHVPNALPLSLSLSLCVALSHECIHTKGVSWCPVLKEKPSSSSLLLLCDDGVVVMARGKTGHRFSPLASCTLMCAKYASIYTMRYGIVFDVCVCVSVGLAPSVCAPWFDDPQRVAERIWNGASQIMRQIERVSPLSTLLTSSPIRRHEGPTGVFSCLLPPISIDLLCTFGTVCVCGVALSLCSR